MMANLRKWFFAGLLVLAPLSITAWFLNWAIGLLDKSLLLLPLSWHPDRWLPFHIPGLGVLLTLGALLLVGAIASNFLGKRLVAWWDRLLGRIPVVRSIYTSVKQVSDTLFSTNGNAFRKAVLVQWPHQGMWTIGFVTGSPSTELSAKLPTPCVSVYVPTTPNPTGGYFVVVPKEQCQELDMSVDEALKYIVSMGVVTPKQFESQAKKAN